MLLRDSSPGRRRRPGYELSLSLGLAVPPDLMRPLAEVCRMQLARDPQADPSAVPAGGITATPMSSGVTSGSSKLPSAGWKSLKRRPKLSVLLIAISHTVIQCEGS